MSEYTISQVYPTDKTVLAQIDTLLGQEGIRRDGNLDYICAMFDEEYNVIGTGSCFGNTLRCFAVSSAHQGEGLLNQIITHLIEVQCARGNLHLFLYTKVKSSRFFGDLGFYEIARVEDTLVFMENRRDGFGAYLRALEKTKTGGKSAALVMNANPFTLGHQYLVEKAAAACDTLHLFVVSEDASLVPFAVRKKLAAEGVKPLPNVVLQRPLYHLQRHLPQLFPEGRSRCYRRPRPAGSGGVYQNRGGPEHHRPLCGRRADQSGDGPLQ